MLGTTTKQRPAASRGAGRRLAMAAAAVLAAFLAACHADPQAAARAFTASGQHYFDRDEFGKASIQFRNALQRDPASWQARYGLARAEGQMHQWRASFDDLKAVVSQQPSFAPARLALAALYLQADQTALAQQQIDEVRKRNPQGLAAELAQMQLYLTTKRIPEALGQCARLRQLAPRHAEVFGLCGLAGVAARDYPTAETDFRQQLALDPGSVSSEGNLANTLELEGRLDQAEARLTANARGRLGSLDSQLLLADFYFRHRRLQDADWLFAALLARSRRFPGLAATLGNFWISRNELPRAITDFQLAESTSPSTGNELNLASAYLTLRQVSEAERYTQLVLKRDAKDPNGRALEGALAYLRGDYAGAERLIEGALHDDPGSILAEFYLGMTWKATGQLDRAKGAFSDCIRISDRFLQAYVQLGALALGANDWQLGTAYARKVLSVDPAAADGFLLLAQADMIHGDLDDAGRAIAAEEKSSAPPPELRQVAMRYDVLRGDYTAADREFSLALAWGSDTFAMLRWYAEQLASAGETERAIALVQNWLARRPATAPAEELLASLYLDRRELGSAEAAARQAVRLDPNAAGRHELLGQILERQGRIADAAAEFAAALHANSADLRAHLLVGDLLMRQGQFSQAQAHYERAQALSPDSPATKLALAACWADRGINLDQALGMAQQLKSQFPADPRVADALGWIYSQKGLQNLALPQSREAARSLPGSATAQFHLGMALFRHGDRIAARPPLNRALELGLPAPDGIAAAQALGAAVRARSR